MIGLEVIKNNESDNFLYKFFEGIDFQKYKWVIDHEEILFEEDKKFFDSETLNGQDFFKCIIRKNYYIVFLDLKIYKAEGIKTEIETYNDYLKSDCEMIFLCSDAKYINFYCKDREVLDKIFQNCLNNNLNASKINYENNYRTKMSVW